MRLPSYVEPAEPGSFLHMVEPMKALVHAEGPVHMDVISERIRDWWYVGRVSHRLRSNLDLAIERAQLHRDGDFIDLPDRPVRKVRCRDNSRKPEHVAFEEFALAAVSLVDDVGGASRQEVVTHIARLFGWARNGAILDDRMNQAIDLAVNTGKLTDEGGTLRASSPTVSE